MVLDTGGNDQLDDSAVSEQVITAVAEARGVDPLDLPPMYDVIDLEALDRLFDHGVSSGRDGPSRVTFMIAGCEVIVHSDDEVEVTALDNQSAEPSTMASFDEQDEAKPTLE